MDWFHLSCGFKRCVRASLVPFLNVLTIAAIASSQSQTGSSSIDSLRQQRRLQGVPSTTEDRFHNSFSYTLAKVDLSLEQLNRRLDNMIQKLNRIESKVDQSEATIQLRQVEFPSYIDIQLSRISARLDVMEREIREQRYVPRSEEQNGRSFCRGCTQIKDNSPIREMMSQVVADNLYRLEDSMKWQIREQTAAIWDKLERSLVEIEESVFHQINDTVNTISVNCGEKSDSQQTASGSEEMNVLFLVQKAITQTETKFRKLDSDVEKYTRKVMGGIRDLWTSSDQVKISLEEALRLGNQTREIVRSEFQKLHQQIEPLPRLEPRLAEISATLHRNLGDLGATVDRSFASLLVAQNTFIDNCQRLHDEEAHAYDVLQAVVHEMRNRSISDMGRLSADIRTHSDRLGRSFDAVIKAVFAVGNSTADKIKDLSHRTCQQATHTAAEGTENTGDNSNQSSVSLVSQKTSPDYDQDYQVPENEYVDV